MNFGLVTTGVLYNYKTTASNTVTPNIVTGGDGDLSELATWLGFDRITQTMKNKISAGVAPRFAIIDNGFTPKMYAEYPNAFTRLAWTSYDTNYNTPIVRDIRISDDITETNIGQYMTPSVSAGHGDSVVNIIYQLHSKLNIPISNLQFYDYIPRKSYTGAEVDLGELERDLAQEACTIAILEDIYNDSEPTVDIITISLGFYSLTLPGWVILDQLIQAGVVIIASAGNHDVEINQMPAHENDVFALGAIHFNDNNALRRISKQSTSWGPNYGQFLDYMMPGENVEVYYYASDSKINVLFGGTSAAAPIFATLTAFAWRYYQNVQGEVPDTFNFKTLFSESTDGYYYSSSFGEYIVRAPIAGDHSGGRSDYLGYGILDLYDLLLNIDAYTPPGSGDGGGTDEPCIGTLCFEP